MGSKREPLLTTPWRLRRVGVLGINRRVRDFLLRYNPRSALPQVDNKATTAELAKSCGIPMPENYHTVQYHSQINRVLTSAMELPSFVIKPASGSMGNGIVLVREVKKEKSDHRHTRFRISGDQWVKGRELAYHIATILSGLFSLDGKQDSAILQELVRAHPTVANMSYSGVPDARIILLRGIPVLAMLRVTTRESRGRANLHQGAIGVGVDLISGKTTAAMRRGRSLTHHPDLDCPLLGIQLPLWDEALRLAVRTAETVDLGYLGVDIVIDADKGPLLLEANARPGLAIQLACGLGLAHRLEQVEALESIPSGIEEKVNLARELFS